MSPPEVWGPPIWNLFHTLIEKVNENAYPYISRQLFNIIVRICKFLPCPECSNDATLFLAKLKIENLKTKHDLKNTFYIFHNYVNAKKRKPLFNYANINIYKRYKLIQIINNFILAYNTKGNMKLLAESFQRQFIVKDFKAWFSANIMAFFPPANPPTNNIADSKVEDVETEITVIFNSEHNEDCDISNNHLSENVVDCFDNVDIKNIEEERKEEVQETFVEERKEEIQEIFEEERKEEIQETFEEERKEEIQETFEEERKEEAESELRISEESKEEVESELRISEGSKDKKKKKKKKKSH
jgi:hypothetical protein